METTVNAIDIAKYYMHKNLDYPANTIDGNMKTNKLLYFSQLVHIVLNGQPLFDDAMYAFKNGTVIENVRQTYRNSYKELATESKDFKLIVSQNVLKTLEIVEGIFGDIPARELSQINHEQESWKKYHSQCIEGSYFNKELSLIPTDKIDGKDLETFKILVENYLSNNDDNLSFEVINGVKFFYNPEEINIHEDAVLNELENYCPCSEDSYYVYYDENIGLVVA